MKKLAICLITLIVSQQLFAQEWGQKFEQLGTMLPTPNEYRTASGAPGPDYWQQRADYAINVTLDDRNQVISGSETITYFNQSPDPLPYLWIQLEQNMRARDSNTPLISSSSIRSDSIPAFYLAGSSEVSDYDGGFKISKVADASGAALDYTINKTMMRIDLPQALTPGENISFSIDWSYNINDRMFIGGRSGMEYFKEDGNYSYTIAQWFPRMAVYSDATGWQNKQFLGRGEFTLPFGNYDVNITVPADHIIAASGVLQNAQDVLTKDQFQRLEEARKTFDKPVIIVTQAEAEAKEKAPVYDKTQTWHFKAENVRDFAFATSRKFIWDGMAVKIGDKTPMAMSMYPKEGNPLWEKESTLAVKNTIETYSKYTIDYPYPVAFSIHAASIGMEYPMICFNFGRPNPDGTYSENTRNRMLMVVIHEVGHNFFPMIINSDERQWTWMDEGLNTFLQFRTEQEKYVDYPSRRGPPANITEYMKGDKSFIRPIMTNSEQIMQFGNNAYAKPATALNILRETVMGPELFDKAFKTYAQRWAFKHPQPADFFRTMEDASAVDLDWFWRGWFYSVDHVDIGVENVRWFKVQDANQALEGRTQKGKIEKAANLDENGNYTDFSNGYEELVITDTNPRFYGEFRNQIDDDEVKAKLAGKNVYEVTLQNKGGLVMPVIIEWTYKDGSKEVEKIPAEIWRLNETEVTKTFFKDKEVVNITLDPNLETADTDTENNYFPKREVASKFDQFKEGNNR